RGLPRQCSSGGNRRCQREKRRERRLEQGKADDTMQVKIGQQAGDVRPARIPKQRGVVRQDGGDDEGGRKKACAGGGHRYSRGCGTTTAPPRPATLWSRRHDGRRHHPSSASAAWSAAEPG